MLDGAAGKQQVPFDPTHPSYACNSCDFTGLRNAKFPLRKAATAQAKIVGDDPLNLKVFNLPPRVEASPAPEYEKTLKGPTDYHQWKAGPDEYEGRYPCGSLVYSGVWYYGTYCLTGRPRMACGGVGWTWLGPFVGFRYSTDSGKTWKQTACTPKNPLFGENPRRAPVKIGSPHFVDFGKNMEHSPDGYAYLTAHGSSNPKAWNNWIQGDQVFLIRVKPSIETINDRNAYEFFAGHDPNGKPAWTKQFAEIKPLLDWPGNLGCVTATYNPGLKKYLMCVGRIMRTGHTNLLILESEQLAGPWKAVAYLKDFGPEAYFVNIPSKFISGDGKTFWLCYSANFGGWTTKGGDPDGSHYALCLHETKLKLQEIGLIGK
jgi:hypothetical protein